MSDLAAPASSPVRRRLLTRWWAWTLIAFLAGLALMAALVGRFGWFAPSPAPATAVRPLLVAAPAPAALLAVPAPAADNAVLAARAAALAAQLATLEARTAAIAGDAGAAASQAGRAEAMLLAFAARRAIDRGAALGALDAAFRARFAAAQPRETALVEEAAHHPVTLEALRGELEAVSNTLLSGGSWWWSAGRQLGDLIVIHRADAPSPAPADRLARIRRLVDAGQVDAALVEVSRMPGAREAERWSASASRYVEVHHALDAVEAAALLGQAPAPAPPVRR